MRKLFLNMSFTLGEEPPLTLGEELQTARYRLYRSQILQQNMRWKALAEIYTMHSFAPISNLKIFVKICNFFGKIRQIIADFAGVPIVIQVPMWTVPIALTAGNCVILKPSEKVLSASALRFHE